MKMEIRKYNYDDLAEIEAIYARAREQMRKNGNPSQWGNNHPPRDLLTDDIEQGNGYAVISGGKICGVFAFVVGNDPTYEYIEGKWLNDEKYGTIHRIASNGAVKGVLSGALDFCGGICPNIKIDTHEDNKIMRRLLEKEGFAECGIIYVEDGTPRIAYQKRFGSSS